MRKIGAHVSSAGGPTNAVKNILDIGGNCLQIFAGSPRMWARSLYAQSEVQKFNQLVETHHLDPVFIHALYLVNLASDNQELVDKSYTSLLTDLQNGDSINSSGVIVHLGSHQGRGFDSIKAQLVEKISALISATQTTPFLIENSAGQKGKIGLLSEIEILLQEIKSERLKVCLDTAHLFEASYNLTSQTETDKLITELADRGILPHVTLLHLNDSKTALDSKHDQHANLGEGQITLPGLQYFITHPKLNHLPLILEVPGFDKTGPDAKNIAIVQQLTQ